MSNSLTRLEGVNNFTEFVKAFSQFGSEMVDFAHVTGDRQNDLKDERRRAQMSAARTILERSTLMLLTASKVTQSSLLTLFLLCRNALPIGTVTMGRSGDDAEEDVTIEKRHLHLKGFLWNRVEIGML